MCSLKFSLIFSNDDFSKIKFRNLPSICSHILLISIFVGLSPQIYEFHVSTLSDQEPNWISFAVPIINNFPGSNNKSELNQTNSSPMAPINFEGAPKTSTSVALNWLNADKTSKFFSVCYFPLKSNTKRCDEETQLKR